MPEGDTIHRAARKIHTALAGRELQVADAPNPAPRSTTGLGARRCHPRARRGAREAPAPALLRRPRDPQPSGDGNGRWFVRADGRSPHGKPWLRPASGRAVASQSGGKILRLVSASRARNDPLLLQLGPTRYAGVRSRGGRGARSPTRRARRSASLLNDQSLIAGIGNVIRIEALFAGRVALAPGRRPERGGGAQDRRSRELGHGDVDEAGPGRSRSTDARGRHALVAVAASASTARVTKTGSPSGARAARDSAPGCSAGPAPRGYLSRGGMGIDAGGTDA